MASSKIRTHQGKSIIDNEGSRSTITGLFQRVATADQLQRLSGSLQSVLLDGGVLTNEPPDAHEVNLDNTRHSIRGSYEL